MTDWIYENNADNSARFVLGTLGDNPLVCFGINPSTAAPNDLDRTVATVERVAKLNGHDGFVMLNVYAQRATNPRDMHESYLADLKDENERHIAAVVGGRPLTLWAAWGTEIDRRPYLRPLLKDIVGLPQLADARWVSRGAVTKDGHPHHPLYVKDTAPFETYDVSRYRRGR